MANSVRIAASVDDQISGPLDRLRDKFDQMGKGAASASLIGNAGAMALAAGVNLAGQAIGRVTELVGASVAAYREDQVSVAGLTAALAANVTGFDGNTDAIEKTIASRMRLGFSDDAQREGLKILTAATNDSAQALAAQRVAMDLARFRGIDLSTASDMVAKAFNGNVTSLKKLGIELPKGTEGMAALAAITKVAGAAASAYADTDLGKAEAATIRLSEVQERLGAAFSKVDAALKPLQADVAEGAAEFITRGIEGWTMLGSAVTKWSGDIGLNTDEVQRRSLAAAQKIYAGMLDGAKGVEDGGNLIAQHYTKITTDTTKTTQRIADDFDQAGARIKVSVNNAMERVETRMGTTRDKLTAISKQIVSDAWDPLITAAEITATKIEIADTEEALSKTKLTAAERNNLETRLLNQNKSLALLLIDQEGYQRDAGASAKAHLAERNAELTQYNIDTKTTASLNEWGSTWVHTASIGIGGGIDEVYTAGNQIVVALEGLRPSGYNVGKTWTDGVADGIKYTYESSIGAAIVAVEGWLVGQSPPPKGPLHTIDKGGANVGKAWVKGLASGIDNAGLDGALSGIADSLSGGAPSLSGGGGVMTGGSSGGGALPPILIYLDGRELQRSAARWGRLSDGRSQGMPS
ncbi:hypothetical protein UFOVP1028_40 [uncultured Caudovirales phage]|uniref:Uncharacterized protein n=1 Tax=uncultured Caudovirales phage TaxID=2100421 RepID=A0A6J5SM57_9CAUD|nr:hypothetical protein UFOVP960_5 [uncultured Caudovirales phage]CAB4179141.1 hypothetical protein UFOVP1028_40 [uncultured Caudovirales phage]CAB4189442.1 hypothetical protein UFOVP1187_25 [uncultured Caudovirales phage]CAB4192505.1 hypothetical protein UFOVP1235_42 [uncultured Caudovirales phage]CAB4215860.1 hypothetical protein UFOVP1488_25 [uncultured Caudovirales phage]